MSSDSDSEQFFDAEDNTPIHGSKKNRKPSKESLTQKAQSEPNVSLEPQAQPRPKPTEATVKEPQEIFVAPKPIHGGRQKFKELRKRLAVDDEDAHISNPTPPNSQTSSIDGVYASSTNKTQPFRIVELDAISSQSISSLGRVGRILSGQVEPQILEKKPSMMSISSSTHSSTSSPSSKAQSISTTTLALSDVAPLQEPDVIASTKKLVVVEEAPVAPPRRKKKAKATVSLPMTPSCSGQFENLMIETLTKDLENSLECFSNDTSKPLAVGNSKASSDSSRGSTIRSIHSLDIQQVTKGQFVVRPQDNEKSKAADSGRNAAAAGGTQRMVNRGSVGHYSLGSHSNSQKNKQLCKERRKSAGDENMLSDLEILEQVTVTNLDTGERIPLSVAEDRLPQGLNPLSLHIMRLTSEYVSISSMDKDKESDEESLRSFKKGHIPVLDEEEDTLVEIGRMRKKTAKLKKFFGSTVRTAMDKAKSIAQEVSHARHKEDSVEMADELHLGEQAIKLKAANSHKGPYDFEKVQHVQDISNEHVGPIWCMKFSSCGRLLATAGQDKVLRIWIIKDAFKFFQDMRTKYNSDKVSPTPSQESLVSHHSTEMSNFSLETFDPDELSKCVFMPKPFCTYSGHTSDLLDVSWSKNYFILSSSMDKTVRLWHISRKECLCCFQHIDFVTAIVFHPRDNRYFLSGSLDGKIRLWNILDKKVAVWNEVAGSTKLITAANFCQDGKFAVIGSYDGRCIFYTTDQLKYHTQIHVRSTRGRNATGRKISGIEPMPGEDKILVTSNDSRIRLYDLRDLNVSCKYKGYVNVNSQIKASFSHDGKYVISGSENRDIYIWKTNHDYSKFSSVRRDRNDFWEAIKAHNATVTCAIFAPNPDHIIKMHEECNNDENFQNDEFKKNQDPMVEQHVKGCGGYVLISADFNGCIKIFTNKMKPKHSSLPATAINRD